MSQPNSKRIRQLQKFGLLSRWMAIRLVPSIWISSASGR